MSSDERYKYTMKELTIKRSSIKGQITKFKNYLDKISKQSQLSNIEITELSLKIGKFEGLSTKFDELQSEIEVINSANIDSEIDERDNIEQELLVTIATAKTLIEQHSLMQSEQRRESVFHETQCSHDHQSLGFRLPQIQIEKFNGSIFRWLDFRDLYLNLIHNNARIPPIHKFHYLISYLEGEAARVISNLEISSANYNEAWKLLSERYDNVRLLIDHHLSSLLNVQPITRESNKSLRFLVDHVTKNLRALASLGQPTDKWDILLIFILSARLDSRTLVKWEEVRSGFSDIPTFDQFQRFLIDRADVLEALNRNKTYNETTKNSPSTSRNATASVNNNNKQDRASSTKSFTSSSQPKSFSPTCIICNESHRIYDCPTFKSKNIQEKYADVQRYKLCANCLRQGHSIGECRLGPCRECKKRHNTMLHNPSITTTTTINNTALGESDTTTNFAKQQSRQVLLSTALIEVSNPNTNETIKVRALFDCGSQSTFLSKSLQQKLSLQSNPINTLNVIGIGNHSTSKVEESCIAKLSSIYNPFSVTLSCLILEELTGDIPKYPINIQNLNLPNDIHLADPTFDQPAPIDVLIGADIFWDILCPQQRSLGQNNPKLQYSKFGWLLCGPIYTKSISNNIKCNHAITTCSSNDDELNKLLTKFWELEDVPQKPKVSKIEEDCEKHFFTHYTRLDTGRFCVRLPLIESSDCLGDSYNHAKKRLLSLEKRFRKNPNLKTEYVKFINEYSDLSHLSESAVTIPYPSYFLGHHPVFKRDSESTKLRVVFDGSSPTSSGYSLNDIQMVGPNVQDSLFSILIRGRHYKYILTGDIAKMYRQIQVNEQDRNLQLVLWREDESQPIKTLQLNTVTYGTASASFLSTRCLWQVGEECEDSLIKTIIQKDFYVDDLYTGANDEDDLLYKKNKISKTLNEYCFNLRKFKSNSPLVLENLESTNQESLMLSNSTNTLGLGWDPNTDKFNFPIEIPLSNNNITKRIIMSNSFKIFDPLGLLSPSTIQLKMLLQKLWQEKLDWDQPISSEMKSFWDEICRGLRTLTNLQVPRNVLCDSAEIIEIHSFSDASQLAYGACIYVRSINSKNEVTVRLLSKLVPLKPCTIPRAELCAALLAAKLTNSVMESIRYQPTRLVHWCDSTIVLCWLKKNTRQLKTFVANRVGEILEKTNPNSWRYVPTADNPADLISRGVNAAQLPDLDLWWLGPKYLKYEESKWPILNLSSITELPEIKVNTMTVVDPIIEFDRFSNFNRLHRCFAYVKRFIYNLKNTKNKLCGTLTLQELNDSLHHLYSISQRESFSLEYESLESGKSLKPKSKILCLSLFMDKGGTNHLIRVGGRISASGCPFEQRHPILLDSSHRLTKLLFQFEHKRNLHAGPQLLLATIRQTIWPINGRQLARRTYHSCVTCRKIQGKTLVPKMSDLPYQRVNPGFPFQSVGLDFGGPFYILNRKGRGSKLIKCYLCLFVCLRCKCVHLEAVGGLSKEDFLLALRRFISRRGKPSEIFCDNGTNFVAADKELSSFLKANQEPLSQFAIQDGVRFSFIPVSAAHFGGIWESGIKSAKYHIKRVMGNSHLTFEEISTLFAQVEAILNSRPLCPLSSSPDDFLFLSPGHFIIGRPLTSLPSPNFQEGNFNRLQRYQRLEQIRQHFWQRWQKEYIMELQQRTKWKTDKSKLKICDLVLIQEDHVPTLSWRLGALDVLLACSLVLMALLVWRTSKLLEDVPEDP